MNATDRRRGWLDRLQRLAEPVLVHLAAGTLRARLPVEARDPQGRAAHTHLEAVGRLLCGVAPWLESEGGDAHEVALRKRFRDLAVAGLVQGLDPAGPDRLCFTFTPQTGSQPIVDAAFLVQALLRAPQQLLAALPAATRSQLATDLVALRARKPFFNNWLLFAAMIEAVLPRLGVAPDRMRIDYALRQHEQWYVGDGAYRDGPAFHWDHYNSFVIQPMLLDVVAAVTGLEGDWDALAPRLRTRAARYAVVQERLVAPDGSFPPIGRSLAYRCGAFHALAQAALLELTVLPPAQLRGALGAVIARTLDAPGTYNGDGWLRIGLCGHQPSLGEGYISTGSLYLAATAFLPLGLAPDHAFWQDADRPWSAAAIWSGCDMPADSALKE